MAVASIDLQQVSRCAAETPEGPRRAGGGCDEAAVEVQAVTGSQRHGIPAQREAGLCSYNGKSGRRRRGGSSELCEPDTHSSGERARQKHQRHEVT